MLRESREQSRLIAVSMRTIIALMFAIAISPPASARDMKLTIYDDGRSCPANCDAHFVMNPKDNGTKYAFRPLSSRAKPQPCISGEVCTICFTDSDNSCLTARFRGAGPPIGTFDFTPAFYDVYCPRANMPIALQNQCISLDAAVRKYDYQHRLNCFQAPDVPKCRGVMAAAEASQKADEAKRARCLAVGETKFNEEQTDPRQRRMYDCNYSELMLGGSGSRKWHLLLPAACRRGAYVDPFGLDCCNDNLSLLKSPNALKSLAIYQRRP
jgi:hypothetical protein